VVTFAEKKKQHFHFSTPVPAVRIVQKPVSFTQEITTTNTEVIFMLQLKTFIAGIVGPTTKKA